MRINIETIDTFVPWMTGGNDADGTLHYMWHCIIKGKYDHIYKSGKIAEKDYSIKLSGDLPKFKYKLISRRSAQWIRFMFAWKMFWGILKAKPE